MFHATARDIETLKNWINDDPDVAWIIKVRELDMHYQWKAVSTIDEIQQQEYVIWHIQSHPLSIPSGEVGVPDTQIKDPFVGWSQRLKEKHATTPWFGANLPGPYHLVFAEDGCESPGSIARSEFNWDADRYKSIGKPAHPEAKKWWDKLKRYVEKSTIKKPWVSSLSNVKRIPSVYIFPHAERQIEGGRIRDINPWSKNRVA